MVQRKALPLDGVFGGADIMFYGYMNIFYSSNLHDHELDFELAPHPRLTSRASRTSPGRSPSQCARLLRVLCVEREGTPDRIFALGHGLLLATGVIGIGFGVGSLGRVAARVMPVARIAGDVMLILVGFYLLKGS